MATPTAASAATRFAARFASGITARITAPITARCAIAPPSPFPAARLPSFAQTAKE